MNKEVDVVPVSCFIGGLEISSCPSVDELAQGIVRNGNVKYGFAIAVNAEKIVASYENPDVHKTLSTATMLYPDGAGVSLLMSKRLAPTARIPGCDLWMSIMGESAKHKVPVFIVGATKEVNEQTVQRLLHDGVNVVGSADGYFASEEDLVDCIKSSKAKIITVALGSPRQENFINKCRQVYPDAFYMGVGGTYDVFVGRVKRAPQFWQNLNLEWLYRLVSEPKRAFRQIKLIKYIWLIATKKI